MHGRVNCCILPLSPYFLLSLSLCPSLYPSPPALPPSSKQHRSAVLALQFPQPSCLVSTSYDKTVREFDLRVPISLVADHQEHKKPVLALATTENYVYSAGEDRTVCMWDRRSRNILQSQKVR